MSSPASIPSFSTNPIDVRYHYSEKVKFQLRDAYIGDHRRRDYRVVYYLPRYQLGTFLNCPSSRKTIRSPTVLLKCLRQATAAHRTATIL